MQALEAAVAQSADPPSAHSTTTPRSEGIADQITHLSSQEDSQKGSPEGRCGPSSHSLRRLLAPLLPPMPGHSALQLAIISGNESMARFLIERGANVTRQDRTGLTPLHVAAERGNASLVRLLLDRLADPNAKDFAARTALFPAVQSDSFPVSKMLLEAGADVNSTDALGNVPLHIAVALGSQSIVQLLLEYGADIEA